MKKLPADFEINKYGLYARFVIEDDASFILKLRTNEELCKYIHSTENDIEKQKRWITDYKKREREGIEYYFIYYYDNKPIGLNRIYKIDFFKSEATGGSFVFEPGCLIELPILATLIQFDIAFNLINIENVLGDIRLENKKVIKFHKLLEVQFTSKDDLDLYYTYDRDSFEKAKIKIEKMLLPIK